MSANIGDGDGGPVSAEEIGRISIFQDLGESERAEIAALCTKRLFRAEEVIISTGGADHDVYFMLSGRAEVLNHTIIGNALHLDALAVGAYFGELSALESGMLTPKKSLLAVFGVTSEVEKAAKVGSLVPCESCSLPGCAYRRKPYFLDTMKDLANEQKRSAAEIADGGKLVALDTAARYSISPRALRKWAESRLELRPADGGGFEAVFTYDGTTCSNMGHPLRYLYRVSLGGPETRYTILDASCAPVEGDEGHKRQCEYLKNGDRLKKAVAGERPLVGEPLDAVLSWNPPSTPSGCYCDESSRNHKWTIAYEVLHFSLAQRERERLSAG